MGMELMQHVKILLTIVTINLIYLKFNKLYSPHAKGIQITQPSPPLKNIHSLLKTNKNLNKYIFNEGNYFINWFGGICIYF